MKKVLLSSVAALAVFAAAAPVFAEPSNQVTQKNTFLKVLMFKLTLTTRTQKDMQRAQFQKFV